MRKGSYLVALALFVLCFGLGLLSVILPREFDDSPQQARLPPTNQEKPWSQISHDGDTSSILILGVDRIQKSNPRLISIWLASVHYTRRDIHLFGFPTNLPTGGEERKPLDDIFSFNRTSGVGEDFLQAFININPFGDPTTIILIDETMFAALVDYVGGVHLEDTFLSGDVVVSFQELFYNDAQGLLFVQAQVLDNLRHRSSNLTAPLDVTPLLKLSREHAYTSMDAEKLALWISTFLPGDPKGIRIEIHDSNMHSTSGITQP